MAQSDEIRSLLNSKFQAKQDRIGALPGQLGDGYGNITVTGREHYVYCRLAGTTVEVFNNRVPAENDLLVMAGYDPIQPDIFQVLSTRTAVPGGTTGGAITGYASSSRYQWMAANGGQDPLFIDKRQYLPLRPGAGGGMLLQVYRDFIFTGTGWVAVNTQTVDLSTHIPVTTGKAALVLITIDNTGAVVHTKGSEVDITALASTDLPTVPANTVEVLGAVRVYYGQTAIYEARTNTDIIDLRDTWTAGGALADHDHSGDAGDGGVFDAANLTSGAATDGYVLTADGSGGAAWEAAASSGHTIQDEGTPLTARANLNFVGAGVAVTDDAGNNASIVTIGGASGHTIQDEGSSLTARSKLNFTGPFVTATDDAGNDATKVDVNFGTSVTDGVYAFAGSATYEGPVRTNTTSGSYTYWETDFNVVPSFIDLTKVRVDLKAGTFSLSIDGATQVTGQVVSPDTDDVEFVLPTTIRLAQGAHKIRFTRTATGTWHYKATEFVGVTWNATGGNTSGGAATDVLPVRLYFTAYSNAALVIANKGLVPSTVNVSNPPTDAELDASYGTPATVGAGFMRVLNDNNAGANVYLIASDGTNWWYSAMTKAT